MQHLKRRGHIDGVGKRRADVFECTRAAGVDGIQVHFQIVCDVASHHRALQEVYVVQNISDPRRVVQILQRAFAIVVAHDIHHVHGCTRGTIMNSAARELHVVLRIATEVGNAAVCLGLCVFDQRAGKANAPVVTKDGARSGQIGNAAFRRIGQADLFQRIERGAVNAKHFCLGQGVILAAGKARTDRAQVVGQGCVARSTSRRTSAAACWGLVVHKITVFGI